MPSPQPGLLADGLSSHHHVEFTFDSGLGNADIIAAVSRARTDSIWLGGPNVVWGFGPDLWRRLSPKTIPDSVQPMQAIAGPAGHDAPATQYDVWAWCSSYSAPDVGRARALIVDALASVASLNVDLPAYKTEDSRDPTGFIDGTENPLLDEAVEVALFPNGSVGAGGSAVLVQKWVHNLAAFDALREGQQEDVFGRTKAESIQLPDDIMPTTSHVSRNTVLDATGEERHIYRKNTPFAMGDEAGTQFIGATNDPDLMDLMLQRMFGVTADGLTDHMINYSTPVTGSYYFVPAVQECARVFGPLSPPDDDDAGDDRSTAHGSLNIGSLLGWQSSIASGEDDELVV